MSRKRSNFLTSLKVPFVQKRKLLFLIPVVLAVLGILCMILRGFAWDTDFIGGTSMQIHIGPQLTTEELANITVLTEGVIQKKVSAVQRTGEGNEDVLIKCTEIDTETRDEVFHVLMETYGLTDADRLNVTSIGASVSADFRRAGIISVSLAVVLMLVYITIRFSLLSGVAAVVCLTHDLFMMLFAYSLLQLPMNSNIIAALLTILGYSINATIIVFDRVRENLKRNPDASFSYNVNLSINQTLMRSVNTTITTLLTIVMIYIFGVTSIKQFILPLIVGIIAGLYSSVCLAGNIWCVLQELSRKKDGAAAPAKKEKKKKVSPEAEEEPKPFTEEELEQMTKETSVINEEMK